MLIIWSFRNLHSKYDTVGFKGWKVIKVLKTFPLHSQMQIEGGTQDNSDQNITDTWGQKQST